MTALATGRDVNALDSFGVAITGSDPIAALIEADADFTLRKEPLDRWSGKPCGKGLHVVIREDTETAIGQVGDNYEPFPNRDFFGPVAEALIEQTGAHIERFASLDDGRRAFMRFAWDDDHNLRIGGVKVGDVVGRRCIVSTAHDGKWAGRFSMQMLRLVCSNGMVAPIGTADMTLTHTVGGHQQLADLGEMAPTIELYVRQFQRAADMLADTPIAPTDPRCEEIIKRVCDPKGSAKDTQKGEPNRAKQHIAAVMELFDGNQPGATNRAINGTGWGLYNAIVDHLTHGEGTRGENVLEQRYKSLLPGGSRAKQIVSAWTKVTDGLGLTEAIETELAQLN